MKINNSISEFFYNQDFGVIDIKPTSDGDKFSVSDYILTLLLHNAFKTFDGGESFTGSIISLLTSDSGIKYQGNLKHVIINTSLGDEQKNIIVDEIRSCLKVGVDAGIFALASQNDIIVVNKNNDLYITINIIVNKKRESLVFYYDKSIGSISMI